MRNNNRVSHSNTVFSPPSTKPNTRAMPAPETANRSGSLSTTAPGNCCASTTYNPVTTSNDTTMTGLARSAPEISRNHSEGFALAAGAANQQRLHPQYAQGKGTQHYSKLRDRQHVTACLWIFSQPRSKRTAHRPISSTPSSRRPCREPTTASSMPTKKPFNAINRKNKPIRPGFMLASIPPLRHSPPLSAGLRSPLLKCCNAAILLVGPQKSGCPQYSCHRPRAAGKTCPALFSIQHRFRRKRFKMSHHHPIQCISCFLREKM